MKASHKTRHNGNQHGSKKQKHPEKDQEQLDAMMTEAAKKGAKELMESLQHKNKKSKKTATIDSDDECNQFLKLAVDDSDTNSCEMVSSN